MGLVTRCQLACLTLMPYPNSQTLETEYHRHRVAAEYQTCDYERDADVCRTCDQEKTRQRQRQTQDIGRGKCKCPFVDLRRSIVHVHVYHLCMCA